MAKWSTPDPKEVAKADAWVSAIRGLARIHRCAHTIEISHAVKVARTGNIPMATKFAIDAGIPAEELKSVETLIFK